MVTVTLSPGFSVLRFQPSRTSPCGPFISIAQTCATPAVLGTSTEKEECGLVQLNSFTVPTIFTSLVRSNMAPEWWA